MGQIKSTIAIFLGGVTGSIAFNANTVAGNCTDPPGEFVRGMETPPPVLWVQTIPQIPPGTVEPQSPDWERLPDTPMPTEPAPSVTPPETAPETPASAPGTTVMVREVTVLGNTVFSPEEIQRVVGPYEGKSATFEDLLAIRMSIADLYVAHGYVTSGAFLPPQDVSDGAIEIQAVEGELERIEIEGLNRLTESYLRDRIGLAADPPIDLYALEQALQLLQLDPRLSSVRAQLKAGTAPGRSVLTLQVTEASAMSGVLKVENYDSPTVGSIRYSAALSHNNVLGFGDAIRAEYGRTAGVNDYDIRYEVPVNARNGTLSLRYRNSDSNIIEDPFDELEIEGRTQTVSIGFRQPIVQSSESEFALSVAADWRQSRTFLYEDMPFSFSSGPEKGESKVTALRLTQEWVRRTPKLVLAARSQFSVGLDLLGATARDNEPDGQFVSWLGQFQWVQDLGGDVLGVARFATQLTPNSLLPLEQFSIGGIDTVRGYRQNQRVGDNGAIASLELRVPLIRDPEGWGSIQMAPFIDVGTVWQTSGKVASPNTLVSGGLGVRWQHERFSARLDWGFPLSDIERRGESLQDNGVVFSFQVYPF